MPSKQNEKQRSDSPHTTQAFIVGFWGVRYQVKDVQGELTSHTQTLGFNLDMQNLPAFGQVSIGGLKLILSGPGAAGSRPMPDGRQQEPGGWNRVLLQVQDLPARIADLKEVILGVLIRMVIPSYFRSAAVFRFGHFNVRLMDADQRTMANVRNQRLRFIFEPFLIPKKQEDDHHRYSNQVIIQIVPQNSHSD